MKHTFSIKSTSFLLSSVAASALLAPSLSYAIDINPVLTAGSATISQAGNVTTVTQTTAKAIYQANNLDTTAVQTLNVNTPDVRSIGLFRVSGAATQFNGALNSNGQIWIVNPNGMVFGSTANVNVGGLLVSTANISDNNFLNPSTDGTNTRYVFDQPGNPQAAIVVKSGANIVAKYPDGTYQVLLNEQGGEVGAGGTTGTDTLDAQDLTNWILEPGTTVDSVGSPTNIYGYSNFDPANHPQFFDMDGTSSDWSSIKPAVLTSKSSFNLAQGQYTISFDAAGNGRSVARDGLKIEIIDANNNVLYSNNSVYSRDDAWSTQSLTFTLNQPVTGLRVRISGYSLDLPAGQVADNMGVSLGQFQLSYRPTENPYVTFMAPAVRQESGSHVEAINGAINYAAGSTFVANHVDGTTVNSVTINDPVRMAAIIDGVQATSPIEIQQGAQLWAALIPDSPIGTVTIQSKITQSAFNKSVDKNANGVDDHTTTTGPGMQIYDSSEAINIANGADIRPAPINYAEDYNSNIRDPGTLKISSIIVPDDVVIPPVVVTPTTPSIPTFSLSQNAQVAPPVVEASFAQISARDVVSRNFVNATDSVDPTLSVTNGLSLSRSTGVNPETPSTAAAFSQLSPAAGGSASDYANLKPAAGGNSASGSSTGGTGGTACANETLDSVGFLNNKTECNRQPAL